MVLYYIGVLVSVAVSVYLFYLLKYIYTGYTYTFSKILLLQYDPVYTIQYNTIQYNTILHVYLVHIIKNKMKIK